MSAARYDATQRERELEREAERLRAELDEERRERERDAKREEEARLQRMRDASPSNRLYRGEITDAREALRAHIAALQHERTIEARFDAETRAELDRLKSNGATVTEIDDGTLEPPAWDEWIAAAELLLSEYEETVGRAISSLAERWLAEPEGSTRHLAGESLRDGDFSRLAI